MHSPDFTAIMHSVGQPQFNNTTAFCVQLTSIYTHSSDVGVNCERHSLAIFGKWKTNFCHKTS